MRLLSTLLSAALFFSAPAFAKPTSINETYIVLAQAVYGDTLISARVLQSRIDALLEQPSPQTLAAARDAWRAARVPYLQSETFRFANPEIDEWEGKVNAWPLDEGLIDYVASGYFHETGNIGAQLNIIANPVIRIGGQKIDARDITPALIESLHEFAGSEVNVASGYHAIEFLLWGQDLNGTGPGAGERPHTDYLRGDACTHGHCDRRRAYLKAVTQLLVDDLDSMAARWQPGADLYKKYQTMAEKDVLGAIVFSIGSLSLGELAGERMKVALEANSTEDEQDCFSDNTHWSHYYNALGMQNLYLGQYQRIDGSRVGGPSLASIANERAPKAAKKLKQAIATSVEKTRALVEAAEHSESPMKFDQMIAERNPRGHALVGDAINALVAQTAALESLAQAMDVDSAGASKF